MSVNVEDIRFTISYFKEIGRDEILLPQIDPYQTLHDCQMARELTQDPRILAVIEFIEQRATEKFQRFGYVG